MSPWPLPQQSTPVADLATSLGCFDWHERGASTGLSPRMLKLIVALCLVFLSAILAGPFGLALLLALALAWWMGSAVLGLVLRLLMLPFRLLKSLMRRR